MQDSSERRLQLAWIILLSVRCPWSFASPNPVQRRVNTRDGPSRRANVTASNTWSEPNMNKQFRVEGDQHEQTHRPTDLPTSPPSSPPSHTHNHTHNHTHTHVNANTQTNNNMLNETVPIKTDAPTALAANWQAPSAVGSSTETRGVSHGRTPLQH